MINKNIARIALFLGTYGTVLASSLLAQSEISQSDAKPPPPPVPRVYDGVAQTPWHTHPEVTRQLNLTPEQVTQLNRAYSQAWDRYNGSVNSLGPELTPTQRWQQLHQLHNGFYNNFRETAGTVITDPATYTRYNQLQTQYRGYGAFNEPSVQQQLDLSESQRRDLNQANYEWNQRMTRWNQGYSRDADRVIKEYNAGRGDYNEHLKSVLTPQQQRRWEAIVGQPYEFPAEAYFDGRVTRSQARPASQ